MSAKSLNPTQIKDAQRLHAIFHAARRQDRSLTQEKLAFICGWKTQGAVSQYLLGKIPLNLEALLRFSKALQVEPVAISPTLAAFLPPVVHSQEQQKSTAGDECELQNDLMQLKESIVHFGSDSKPRISYEVVQESEPVAYPLAWLKAQNIYPEKIRRFRVNGENMEPFLFNGDTVLVNLDETTVSNSKVYALRYGKELRIQRLFKKLDGTLILRSDNTSFIDEEVLPEQVEKHITIIGRVRGKFGYGGL